MLIAVNTRLLLRDKLEGIGWFTFETLKRITKDHPEHQFLFLFDRPFSEDFIFSKNITPIVAGLPTRHPVLWYLWLEYALPRVFKKYQPDLFLSPDGFLSLRSQVKSLPVIHDLNFEHYPKEVPGMVRCYYQNYFPQFAKKATRVATVSEYSKQDIVNQYEILPEIIDVVYDGANEAYRPINEDQKVQVRKKISQGEEYFLFVGALNPRKNVARLLQAFDAFKKQQTSKVKLVIAGARMWKTDDIEAVYNAMQYKEDVVFTGRLGMSELKEVYGAALALAFVPYFEGFGIPIAEAMYCDVPVIAANVTSMPEVVGEAGLLVDPFSVDSIKDAMIRMYKDNNLRNQLVAKGRIQRERFSWDKSAALLWDSVEKCFR